MKKRKNIPDPFFFPTTISVVPAGRLPGDGDVWELGSRSAVERPGHGPNHKSEPTGRAPSAPSQGRRPRARRLNSPDRRRGGIREPEQYDD